MPAVATLALRAGESLTAIRYWGTEADRQSMQMRSSLVFDENNHELLGGTSMASKRSDNICEEAFDDQI